MKNILRMALTLPLVYSMASYAEIYRWVDKNGVTHYSDMKPITNKKPRATGEIEVIEYSYSYTPEDEKDTEDEEIPDELLYNNDLDKTEGDQPEQEESRTKALQQAAARDKCKDLRFRLAALEEKGAPVFEDEDGAYRLAGRTDLTYSGERTYLSDSTVAERREMVNTQIEEDCSDSESQDDSLQEKARADWVRSQYCEVNQNRLDELKKPEARTADSSIEAQQELVDRYCDELEGDKYRKDEKYYPRYLPQVSKKQNTTADSTN